MKTLHEHGWSKYFEVDLLDAEGPDMELPIPNGKVIHKNFVGKDLADYDSLLVLSHFKGHPMGGYGGALKQLSIGIASSAGKAYIHGAGEPGKIWTADHDSFLESMADAASSIVEYFKGNVQKVSEDGYFGSFIADSWQAELWFIVFAVFVFAIILGGVQNGIERMSRIMMPVLVILAVVVTIYSVTRPGALEGVKYFLIPNVQNFSWMTVVTAMGQMFYSLSIAMGILVTFGSYMKKDVSIEESTENVELFDTAIAIMAGLMIIPAVFSFSGGDPDTLQAGPALMFITIPKVFESMGFGHVVGILFFLLVLFAAVTSSIALTESAVSTFEDELGWSRERATALIGLIMVALGSLSALGYGPLAGVTVFGMQFLDFFDFLTNSVMMPIAAIAICLLVSRVIGVQKIEEEVTLGGKPFRRKKIFNFMIQYLCPIFAAIILISSVANALGWIAM